MVKTDIRNDLVFGNVSARAYDVYVSGEGVYEAPSRVVETVDIPGRNGALLLDKGAFENITIEYPCFVFGESQGDFRRKINAYKNALMSQVGYQRLSDTYNPNEYREAVFIEGFEADVSSYGQVAEFTLKFYCKPQRFLLSGESDTEVENGDTIVNPTEYEAKPLLKIYGYGSVTLNDKSITLQSGVLGEVGPLWEQVQNSGAIYNTSSNTAIALETAINPLTIDLSKLQDGDTISFKATTEIHTTNAQTLSTCVVDDGTYTTSTTSNALYVTAARVFEFAKGVRGNESCNVAITTTSGQIARFDMRAYYEPTATNPFTIVIEDASLSTYFDVTVNCIVFGGYGNSTMSLVGNPTYIDCETGECYKIESDVMTSLNSYVTMPARLPTLPAGECGVTLSNTITRLLLVPRWWRL